MSIAKIGSFIQGAFLTFRESVRMDLHNKFEVKSFE
jgi:hypothetical protein